tara:strand:+ start:349 stop:1275 length:927 start_codon:yes stop_codon:yes gene_type:complete
MSNNVVPVSECDYLEEDPEIRGQKFCCVSFISPEKLLDDKNTFIFTEFTKNFCKDMNELFHNMKEKYSDDADGFQAIADRYRFLFNKQHMQDEYKYFCEEKSEELDKQFNEQVDFQTNVRGLKVRGSYDTLREAQVRSEVLKRKDKNHNIFICQVGCWCPWDPSADQIDDQHYSEDQLNTLMKKYRENQAHKDEVFNDRKREMLEAQKEKNKKVEEENLLESNVVEDVEKTIEDGKELVEDVEKVVEKGKEVIEDVKQVVEDVKEVITSSGVGEDNRVEENVNVDNVDINSKVFSGEDPWMNSKNQKE